MLARAPRCPDGLPVADGAGKGWGGLAPASRATAERWRVGASRFDREQRDERLRGRSPLYLADLLPGDPIRRVVIDRPAAVVQHRHHAAAVGEDIADEFLPKLKVIVSAGSQGCFISPA